MVVLKRQMTIFIGIKESTFHPNVCLEQTSLSVTIIYPYLATIRIAALNTSQSTTFITSSNAQNKAISPHLPFSTTFKSYESVCIQLEVVQYFLHVNGKCSNMIGQTFDHTIK